jgi:hypothetical protein
VFCEIPLLHFHHLSPIHGRNFISLHTSSNAVDLPVGPLSSFVYHVDPTYNSLPLSLGFHPVLSSSIVANKQLFADLSAIIAFKDRGFVSVSWVGTDWTV